MAFHHHNKHHSLCGTLPASRAEGYHRMKKEAKEKKIVLSELASSGFIHIRRFAILAIDSWVMIARDYFSSLLFKVNKFIWQNHSVIKQSQPSSHSVTENWPVCVCWVGTWGWAMVKFSISFPYWIHPSRGPVPILSSETQSREYTLLPSPSPH